MADESDDGVPEPVREWFEELAEEAGLTEREALRELFSSEGETAGGLEGRLEAVEADVASLEAEFDRTIRDVRERVLQVREEATARAPAGHDHPELSREADRAAELAGAVDDLEADIGRLDERVAALDRRLDGGFENFESVLEYLLETTDAVNERLETVAEVAGDLHERGRRRATAAARRSAADGLRRAANRHGVEAATCEDCGGTVRIGLLSEPECPHCGAGFTELEPRRGFFRSSVLHTGERPALEGEIAGEPPSIAPLDVGSAPTVTGPGEEASGSDAGSTDPTESGGAPSEAGTSDRSTAARTDGDLTSISGIGSAYAERLRGAGVETVPALARADPAELARETDIPAGRVRTLVEQARERVESA